MFKEERVHYEVKSPNSALLTSMLSPQACRYSSWTVLQLFFCSPGECALETPLAKQPPPPPASKSVLSKTKCSHRLSHDPRLLSSQGHFHLQKFGTEVLTFYSSLCLLADSFPFINAIHALPPSCLWLTKILCLSRSI